ncbi:hypothetical protein D3C71_1043710 [compost metagenome]
MNVTAHAVAVFQAGHFSAIAFHFRRLCVQHDIDVLQAAHFILQYLVGFHFWCKFQQRYVFHNAGQIDGGFNAGVTTADHCDALTFKQRAIAVRAVGHAFGAILIFTRHVHVAPFRAGGNDHAARFQHRAGGGFNLM